MIAYSVILAGTFALRAEGPIGGHFVMDPQDAAYATREWLKPKFVISMRYGTTPVLKGTPQEYIAALGQTTTKVFAINPGDRLEF